MLTMNIIYLLCLYRFAQGLRLWQIDMLDDTIAGSSATLSKMAKRLRGVCVTALKKMRRRTGQRMGGRREFVAIDESHFRHKRKVCITNICTPWLLFLYLFIVYLICLHIYFVSASVWERKNGWCLEPEKMGLWNAWCKGELSKANSTPGKAEKPSTSGASDHPTCAGWVQHHQWWVARLPCAPCIRVCAPHGKP